MLNEQNFSLPNDLERALEAELDAIRSDGMIGRIWNKDAAVWTGDDEDKWLGWLDLVEKELGELEKYS
ncbi:MAG: hypothetical protein KDB79_13140, partial [Acidobacteria bacterium]|nr:hypothetical protein [Acidobacteriota bacterium]